MIILINIGIVIATFIATEFSAWFMHKYVMHGFLWTLHQDHHRPHQGFFERNDTFFLIYAIPSSLLMYFGGEAGFDYRFFIGTGILFYGVAYFLVHDVFIHQRFRWFKRTDNFYFRAIRKAHKMHHKHMGKEEGECFGMLIAPLKYYREAMKVSRR